MKKRHLFLPLLIIAIIYLAYRVQYKPYLNEVDISMVPTFSAVPINFKHEYKSGVALPFAGAAVIEVDNDPRPEIFLGGGFLQRDGLFRYQDGEFIDISGESGLSKDIGDSTYGAASIDANQDGYIDLFVARDSGLYLYFNQGGFFEKTKLTVDFAAGEVPLSIALGDINLDGHIDLFVSCFNSADRLSLFYFNAPQLSATSKLLLNSGDNTFTDITEAAGLPARLNAYTAVFVNLNNDALPDLVVAYQDRPAAIYANQGRGRFIEQAVATDNGLNLATGIATVDYDGDDDMDLLLTSTGTSVHKSLLRTMHTGSINSEWVMLRNEGGFRFSDVSDQVMLAEYEQAWGPAFADFNLDERPDLVVSQNAIRYPPHMLVRNPGRLLVQTDDRTFADVIATSHAVNKRYGTSPVIADFNDDGYPDLVWANVGDKAQALINDGGNRDFLKIDLGDLPRALGARVSIDTNGGKHLAAQQVASVGMASDQTHILSFGLDLQAIITRVQVRFPSGQSLVIEEPELNQTIVLKPAPAKTPKVVTTETPVIVETKPAEEYEPVIAPDLKSKAAPQSKPKESRDTEDELEDLLGL